MGVGFHFEPSRILFGPSGIRRTGLGCQKSRPRSIFVNFTKILKCMLYVFGCFCMSLYTFPCLLEYGKDAERYLESACLNFTAWALFWTCSVNKTMSAIHTMSTLYTLYTLYKLFTLYTLYTLYTMYTLYTLCTLYTMCTLYTLCTLYTRYTLCTIQCIHSTHCRHRFLHPTTPEQSSRRET